MKTHVLLFVSLLTWVMPAVGWGAEDESQDAPFISLTRRSMPLSKIPTNVSYLTSKDIKDSGATSIDEVLPLLPSVDVVKSGTLGTFSTVRLRGVPSSAETQVIVDDEPLGGVSAQFIDLSQIPLDNIERIEVVRGGSSVLYGANTIGGVIHVITKKALEGRPQLAVGGDVKSFDTRVYRGRLGGTFKRIDGLTTLRHYRTDGFQHNSDAKSTALTGDLGYSFLNGIRLGGSVSHVGHDVGNPQGTNVPIEEWDGHKERVPANPTKRAEQKTSQGRLNISIPLSDLGLLRGVFYQSRQYFVEKPEANQPPSFDQTIQIRGTDLRWIALGGFTGGLSFEKDLQMTMGQSSQAIHNGGGYVEQTFGRGRSTVIPALRFDHHSTFGSVTNPRISCVQRLTDTWVISGNAAKSYRAPSFLELFYQSPFFNGNPNLKPEVAWSYDVGTRVNVVENRDVKLTGFFTKISHRISPTLTTYENLARAEIGGLELESNGRFWVFSDIFNYTFTRAIGTAGDQSTFVPLRMTPRHVFNYQLVWKGGGKVKIINTLQHVSRQYQLNDRQGEILPAYTVWNARLIKTIKKTDLYFGVNNITETRYAESFDSDPITYATTLNPQPGRTFEAGVDITF
ncbi:MAG: TonB-dependent receptor [Elusimicrobia bacterium]|nr:TonB-dependent receptor [Candidatus Obscuribacterium magneticum]